MPKLQVGAPMFGIGAPQICDRVAHKFGIEAIRGLEKGILWLINIFF